MNLRIHRTWSWQRVHVPLSEIRFGGPPPPLELVSSDELQYTIGEGVWVPVEVVEEEKPEHPDVQLQKEKSQRMAFAFAEFLNVNMPRRE